SGSYRPRLDSIDKNILWSDFQFPDLSPSRETNAPSAWETSPHIKEEEFSRAEALALFDYLRKSRSQGFVVSLSGGAHSTCVSYLVARLVDFATADIGGDGFLKKLGYIRGLDQAKDNTQLVHRLLTCVYQATRNSGDVTRKAARTA